MSPSVSLQPLREDDVALFDELAARVQADPATATGYPQVSTWAAFADEALPYDRPPEAALWRVVAETRVVGFVGLLVDEAEGLAWLCGPFVEPTTSASVRRATVLEALRIEPTLRIRWVVPATNTDNVQIADAVGLERVQLAHELVIRLEDTPPRQAPGDVSSPHDTSEVAEAAALFATIHGSVSDPVEWLNEHVRCDRYEVLVARDLGSVVGAVAWQPMPSESFARLEYVAVCPERRKTGVGRRLVDACVGAARAMGLTTMYASVRSENVEALALHQRCGFRVGETQFLFQRR